MPSRLQSSRSSFECGSSLLQSVVGGSQQFEGFLKAYIKHFAFKTVSAEQFRIFFCSYFESTPAIKQVDWQTWFHAPGRHTSQQLPVFGGAAP